MFFVDYTINTLARKDDGTYSLIDLESVEPLSEMKIDKNRIKRMIEHVQEGYSLFDQENLK